MQTHPELVQYWNKLPHSVTNAAQLKMEQMDDKGFVFFELSLADLMEHNWDNLVPDCILPIDTDDDKEFVAHEMQEFLSHEEHKYFVKELLTPAKQTCVVLVCENQIVNSLDDSD